MPPLLRRLVFALPALLMLTRPCPASAWAAFGHATVAQIAMTNVRPATRAAVDRLLQRTDLLEAPQCPAQTLAQVASWADCVRNLHGRFAVMDGWHFQNVALCLPYDLKPSCRDGDCISTQIDRQVRLLKDRKLPQPERVLALVMLIHLVGDIHQPLHDEDHDGDEGGNLVMTDYGIVRNRSLNLHVVWDRYLAERAITMPPAIVRTYSAAERRSFAGGTAQDWGRQGWELARSQAYPTAFGPDYCSAPRTRRGAISESQIEALIPLVRTQIVRGGLRLARLLDEALG